MQRDPESRDDVPGAADEALPAPTSSLPVVGLGASAGGVTALQRFFRHMPADSGMAFVVIVHLSPDYASQLAEVLQQATAMPVLQVTEAMPLDHDRVYVIPPGRYLSLSQGVIQPSAPGGPNGQRAPIDLFFRSLAESQGPLAAAVVLSGSGADGASGVKRVKERGGLVLVQDPDEAEYDMMPRHAVATGLADVVLPVDELPGALVAYWQQDRAAPLSTAPAISEPDVVRAWVAGCATGEEAYSLAILLAEHAASLDHHPGIQVFATDIDEQAITVARGGLYPETIAVDVSPERLQRFFTSEPGYYRVHKEIRDLVLFASHSLLRDPPFSRLDLISCRNLLIYIDRAMQEQVLQLFHFTLVPDGLLLLGSSESTDGVPSLFTPLDKAQRLFQRRTVPNATRAVPELPLTSPSPRHAPHGAHAAGLPAPSFDDLAAQGLARYGPPSVIVNQDDDIVHLARGAGRFLQFADGTPSSSLLKALHPDLRLELRTALYRARQEGQRVETRRVRLPLGATMRQVSASVQPLAEPAWASNYALIFLYDLPDSSDVVLGGSSDAEPLVRQLEAELQRTREQLRTMTEQYETALEEHRAGNEELQAINEELRATTEELETSKEELQSSNEELLTVNIELKLKVDELSRATSDLQSLMASTAIGTIFVDRDLRIKRYTPSAQALINLIPSDVNRPLSHITHRLDYEQLIPDTTRMLVTLTPVEREVMAQDGSWYLLRIQPYRTETDQIDGVVLTFVDISRRRAAEEALRTSEDRLRLLIESVADYAIISFSPDNRVASWNVGARRIFGYDEAEIVGRDAGLLFTPEDRAAGVPSQELAEALERGRAEDERWHIRKDGSRFYANGVMTPLRDTVARGFVKVMRDLTARKQAEDTLRASEARFRTVTDMVPQLIWASDKRGRVSYFNQRWYAYSGLSEEQSAKAGWQQIIHPDDAPGVARRWQQALAAGETFETEYRLRRADGAYRWHIGRIVPLRDAGGQVIGWFGAATDIEVLKQAEAARRESAVLRRLAEAQEEERLRIARDLHDQLGQQITGLLLRLKQLEQSAAGTPLATQLPPLQEIATTLARDSHRLAVNLRPTALDDVGLVPALENLVASWSAESAIPAAFECQGLDQGRLPQPIEVAVFRVAQEALTNVRKHAQATRVGVIIERRNDLVTLVVEDDGRGFAPATPLSQGDDDQLGLLGMRERAVQVGGTLEVETAPDGGTTIFLRIPLNPPADSQ